MGVSFRGSNAYRNNNKICKLVPGKTKVTGNPCIINTCDTNAYLNIHGNSIQGLPEEYQQVEYIESSGTQYINTGVLATQKTSAYVDFQYLKTESTFIFGSRISTGEAAYTLSSGNSNTNIVSAFGSSWNTTIANLDLNRHTFYKNKFKCTLDDNTSIDVGAATTTFTCPGSLYLFACYQTTGPYLYSTSRIFEFKLWQNDRLVRDMVPCYHKEDNVAGFYDLIEDIFYTNKGTGNFIVGPDVVPIPDKPIEILSVGDKSKNLFDKTNIAKALNLNIQQIENGIRITQQTSTTFNNVYYYVDTIENCKGKTYTFKGNSLGDFGNTVFYAVYGTADSPTTIKALSTTNAATFTVPDEATGNLYIRVLLQNPAIEGSSSQELVNLQLEETKSLGTYEPFGYKIPIRVQSKNLFDYSLLTNYYNIDNANNIWINGSNTLGWVKMDYMQLKPLTTYTLASQNPIDVDIRTNDLNVKLFRGVTSSAVFTTDETGMAKFKLFSADAVYPYYAGWIQLEEGSITHYPITHNIYLKEPLRRLGNYADYIDYKNKKVVRRIKEGLLNQNSSFGKFSGVTNYSAFYMDCTGNLTFAQNNNKIVYPILSDKFTYHTAGGANTNNSWTAPYQISPSLATTYNRIVFSLPNTITSTAEAKNWLSENPVKYLAILEEPMTEDIELPNLINDKDIHILSIDSNIQPIKMTCEYSQLTAKIL